MDPVILASAAPVNDNRAGGRGVAAIIAAVGDLLAGVGQVLLMIGGFVAFSVICAWFSLAAERKSERNPKPHATNEILIDPTTKRHLRVWVDPVTGARDYREEPYWRHAGMIAKPLFRQPDDPR
jgi:hypothetical protein